MTFVAYCNTQPRDVFALVRAGAGLSAIRMAASNTSFTPCCVKAEHSMYLCAPISIALDCPSAKVNGVMFFLRNCASAAGSSRRSIFVPTSSLGAVGMWRTSSGAHCLPGEFERKQLVVRQLQGGK
eukprot:c9603_g1_i1.p1 GENE.c9603_g1_i1~~c9603_g1_i1.p1  ORF type:complete len:126 (+),score=20.54 c9603_g1_i1:311-688(+)